MEFQPENIFGAAYKSAISSDSKGGQANYLKSKQNPICDCENPVSMTPLAKRTIDKYLLGGTVKRRAISILRLRRSLIFQPMAALLVVLLIPLLSRLASDAGIQISEASAQVPVSEAAVRANPILQIGLTTIAKDLSQLESDSVSAYLRLHQLPSADSALIYNYGRTDLRSAIRAVMFDMLLNIIRKPASQRSKHEQNLYKWLQELVQQNEIANYQLQLDQFNSVQNDPCHFKLDSDIASEYDLSYDGTPFCFGGIGRVGLLVRPSVPAASYFKAYGLKFSYGKPAQTYPDYASIIADTAISAAEVWGIGAGVAAAAGLAAAGATVAAVLLEAAALAALALQVSATAMSVASAVIASIAGAAFLALGPLAIVIVAVLIAVAAGLQLFSSEQAREELSNLNSLLNQARNTPPDLLAFALDSTGLGTYKLQATFIAQTLPEMPSTATLPSHRVSDLNFAIQTSSATSPTISSTLNYKDWYGNHWSAQTYGGWFVQSCTSSSCSQDDSIAASLRFVDGAGLKWTASRVGNKFIVIKQAPASTDEECTPNPATGVSPGPNFSTCSSYLSNSIALKDQGGNLQTVSLSVLAPPVFGGPTTLPFTPKAASSQLITATGNPTPQICFASSTPPLPSDFTLNGAPLNTNACAQGSFKLSFNGNQASPTQNYLLTLAASNGTSTQPVTGQFTLDVSPHLGIISPSTLTGSAGFPFNFLVEATGFPTPTLTIDPGVLVNGLSFRDNRNGTATISGIVPGGVTQHQCLIFNGGTCGVHATNSQGTVVQQLTLTFNPAPSASVNLPSPATTFIAGAPNSVTLTSSGASTPVSWQLEAGTAPSWLTLTDNGDGTANLSGTPPLDAVGKLSPGVSPFAYASGPFVFYTRYPIVVVKTPVFISGSTATFTVGSRSTFTASANLGKISLVGKLLTGLSFLLGGTSDCPSPSHESAACIEGTPDAGTAGQYEVALNDDPGSEGTISQPLIINVYQGPTITSSNTATFITQTPGSFAVTTTGFPNTSTQPVPATSSPPSSPSDGKGMFFVLRGLPADLEATNLNSSGFATGTLMIQGTPSVAGQRVVQITAQNGVGATANQSLILNTLQLTAPDPVVGTGCNGNYNSVFAGNLLVGTGQNCTFVGGGVTGTITVNGGNLALYGATVNGDVVIQGPSSSFLIESGTTIGRSLNILGIGANPGRNEICGAVVNGDVIVDGNMTPLQIGSFAAVCQGNVFGGNLIVANSMASAAIYNNVIGNTLVCSNDTLIAGEGNSAAAKTGICRLF
jgi:hypothetical protein